MYCQSNEYKMEPLCLKGHFFLLTNKVEYLTLLVYWAYVFPLL